MLAGGLIRKKYDLINCIEDLIPLISDSNDGEAPWLEFKAINNQERKNEKDFLVHQKSLLAKEICAFLNTLDGIIVWGVEYSESDGIKIRNDYDGNLYEVLDSCIQTIVEPTPSGINFKSIEKDNKKALLIFVPRSNMMPHRVWGGAGDSFRRNYYVKSGTNSVALNESMVRLLYRSDGYVPRISTFIEPKFIASNIVSLEILANPDSLYYIDKYYSKGEVILLDKSGFPILTELNGSAWIEIEKNKLVPEIAIYPADSPIQLYNMIVEPIIRPGIGYFAHGPESIRGFVADDILSMEKRDFDNVKFILTRSYFACNKVSITIDKRLYILNTFSYIGDLINNGKSNFCFVRKEVFRKIESDYNIKIYVLNTYADDDIINDYDYNGIDPCYNGKINISFLKHILNNIKDL